MLEVTVEAALQQAWDGIEAFIGLNPDYITYIYKPDPPANHSKSKVTILPKPFGGCTGEAYISHAISIYETLEQWAEHGGEDEENVAQDLVAFLGELDLALRILNDIKVSS